jgi:hypothetical protein
MVNYFEQFLEYMLVTWLLSSFEDINCRYVENIYKYLDGRLYLYDNHKGVTKPSNTTIDVIKLFNDYNCFGPL